MAVSMRCPLAAATRLAPAGRAAQRPHRRPPSRRAVAPPPGTSVGLPGL